MKNKTIAMCLFVAACLFTLPILAQDISPPVEEAPSVEPPVEDQPGGTNTEITNSDEPLPPSYEGVELPEEEPLPDPSSVPSQEPSPISTPVPPPAPVPAPAPISTPATEPPAPAAIESDPSTVPEEFMQPSLMTDEASDLETGEAEEKHTFSWFSLSPQFGYTFFPESKLTVNGLSAVVQPRNGFSAKLHLDLGGDGIAFEFAPLFALEAGGIDSSGGSFGDVKVDVSSLKGSFQAIGFQTGLVYRFKIGQFYPHVGLGLHSTFLMGDDIEFGAELYGRIPVGFTVYVAKSIALTVEFGFMVGVTGIKQSVDLASIEALSELELSAEEQASLDQLNSINSQSELTQWYDDNRAWVDAAATEANAQNPDTNISSESLLQDAAMDALSDAIRFGQGIGIDFMIGVRFP